MKELNEQFFLYNGSVYHESDAVFGIQNASLKYGDGLFETMLLTPSGLQNSHLHFDRFFSGMKLLGYSIPDYFTREFFEEKIQIIAARNGLENNSRIRLMAYRAGNGVDYVIEAHTTEFPSILHQPGIRLGLYTGIRKSDDAFSNLKSNNYLPGVLTMQAATEQKTDECLILNVRDRVCESAIANVFVVRDGRIFTPALSEGCVAGTVRRWLLENASRFSISETKITLQDIETADELFLTNSIRLLRWVAHFGEKEYKNEISREVAEFILDNMVNWG